MNKKKLYAILIAIVTIFNIFALTFIFIEFNLVKAPNTTIKIDIIEINTEEATIETELSLHNPNGFNVYIRDIEIVTTTPGGKEVSLQSRLYHWDQL